MGDLPQRLPHPALQVGAGGMQRQLEAAPAAGEVLSDLLGGALDRRFPAGYRGGIQTPAHLAELRCKAFRIGKLRQTQLAAGGAQHHQSPAGCPPGASASSLEPTAAPGDAPIRWRIASLNPLSDS